MFKHDLSRFFLLLAFKQMFIQALPFCPLRLFFAILKKGLNSPRFNVRENHLNQLHITFHWIKLHEKATSTRTTHPIKTQGSARPYSLIF